MNIKEIKTKRPWKRVLPDGYMSCSKYSDIVDPNDPVKAHVMTQSDFIREYYPTSHVINDHDVYPDIFREEVVPLIGLNGEDTGKTTKRYYRELVPRCSFPFQKIITLKQLVHLCGNDTEFDLISIDPTDQQKKDFQSFKDGWADKDMDTAFYELARSVKITGDGAIVGFMDKGTFGWKSLSYLNGDKLYPHYDSVTGKMSSFARVYSSYDDEGNEIIEWIELWDEKFMYRFKKNKGEKRGIFDKIFEVFNLSGYTLVSKQTHGFSFVPVVYHRDDDGPCWVNSQDAIDNYELSFSQMKHNNHAYGEPILMLIGNEDSVDIQHDINGTIKSMSLEEGAEAKYLQSQSASESYMKQLEQEYKMIYEGSFTVTPPELKSGDLPAAALKILYSPAVEKAMDDANQYKESLGEMVVLFKSGYGLETENTIGLLNLKINAWINPYVHVNTSTVITDLATAVQNGFCSKQTASERSRFYTIESEWNRIVSEMKEEEKSDIIYQKELNETKPSTESTSSDSTTTASNDK